MGLSLSIEILAIYLIYRLKSVLGKYVYDTVYVTIILNEIFSTENIEIREGALKIFVFGIWLRCDIEIFNL